MSDYEIKPIEVAFYPDHLTIKTKQLEELPSELFEKFNVVIPKGMRQVVQDVHAEECLLLFGTPEEIVQFLWNETQDFDLLLV